MQRAWTHGFKSFLDSQLQLIASSDIASPINTAVMLLKPNLSIFEEGLRVLQRKRFDPLLGFDRVGAPQSALVHLRGTLEWQRINRTTMLRKNDWNFVGGHACQGLFVYLFLVRSEASLPFFAFPKNLTFRTSHNVGTMRLRHFGAGTKPWRPSVRCRVYFNFMNHADAQVDQHDAYCWRLFRQKRACLDRQLERAACAECRRARHVTLSCGAAKSKAEACKGTEVLVM